MRIGIDARLYQYTGIGRYIQNLIRELSKIDKKNTYIVYFDKKTFDTFILPSENWQKKLLDIKWHSVREQVFVPSIFSADKIDVAHFTYFNVPIFYPNKYLLTIHDLIINHFDTGKASTHSYLIYKIKRIGYRISLDIGIKKASKIVTISNTTRNELLDHYDTDPDKVEITYDALDSEFKNFLRSEIPSPIFRFPYLLYIGNAYPHKNLERLIEAFKIVRENNKDLKMVLAGFDEYFYPRLQKLTDNMDFYKEIYFFGNADNKALFNLYKFAAAIISPSLMEGFGLPNLEGASCKKVLLLSDIPVYREIWGEDAIFFDPYDINDIADKINYFLKMPVNEKNRIIKKELEIIKNYSWKKTAEKTLKTYEEIYHKL